MACHRLAEDHDSDSADAAAVGLLTVSYLTGALAGFGTAYVVHDMVSGLFAATAVVGIPVLAVAALLYRRSRS